MADKYIPKKAASGKTYLCNWWDKVTEINSSTIFSAVSKHIAGAKDRHKAEDIDYSDNTTVKEQIDKKADKTDLANKVDKVEGKGLSTNDLTDEYKGRLDALNQNLSNKASCSSVLMTIFPNEPFTPKTDYHPATKKYVDDNKTPVVDNLTSTSTTSALSANQGKVLNDKVTDLPIKSLAGQTVKPTSSTSATAKEGATIIGDLRERTFDSGGDVTGGNVASGGYSATIGGYNNTASEDYSVAMGYYNRALAYQIKIGQYAKDGTAGASKSTAGDAFTIGNGNPSSCSNAFRVTYDGKAYGLSAYGSSGADYVEYFEWKDGNPDNEDRRGRLVTLDGEKIRFATAEDDYILGIVSANPCVEGDIQPDDWQGKYLTDVFGQRLTQTVHIPARYEEHEAIDPETGETKTESILIEKEHDAVQWIINPDYDQNKEYISREDRPEWAPVGMMGKLVVVDDGTCEVNGFCKAGINGIATKADNGYRVMKRIDETHILVLVR